jgi:hypothetical protein
MNHPDQHESPSSQHGTALAPPYRAPVHPAARSGAAFIRVAFKEQADSEISILLRRRLRVAALIVTGGHLLGVLNVTVGALLETPAFSGPMPAWYQAIQGFTALLGVGVAVLLWSKRPFAHSQLRGIELGLVVAVMFASMWGQYYLALPCLPEVVNTAPFLWPTSPLVLLANSINLFWLTIIVGYGLFIPNALKAGYRTRIARGSVPARADSAY